MPYSLPPKPPAPLQAFPCGKAQENAAQGIHCTPRCGRRADNNSEKYSNDNLQSTNSISEDELFVIDYLDQLGYHSEAKTFKIYNLYYAYKNACKGYYLFKLLLLFKNLSDIFEDSYEFFYGNTDDYIEVIEEVEAILDDDFDVRTYANYLFDVCLSSYLYAKYKEDSEFIHAINDLNMLTQNSGLLECLNRVGIDDLEDESVDKFIESLESLVNSLSSQEKIDKPAQNL